MNRKVIRHIKSTVLYLLVNYPELRDSDNKLYLKVCEYINPEIETESFADVFNNYDDYGIPPFETVRRNRQKVQEEHPELQASDTVARFRAENEMIYREEFSK